MFLGPNRGSFCCYAMRERCSSQVQGPSSEALGPGLWWGWIEAERIALLAAIPGT